MVDLNSIKQTDFWYFVGLFVTDGNLSKDGRHVNITSKDIEHLEKVKSALGLRTKITLKTRAADSGDKRYGFLQFSDVSLYQLLLGLGMTPRKSLTVGAIDVPSFYFPDFIRGVIDGDGSIRHWVHSQNQHEQWSLSVVSGSKAFAEWLQQRIAELFGLEGRLHVSPRKLYILKFGKLKARELIKLCYYEGALALSRKKILADLCLKPNSSIRKYNARVAELAYASDLRSDAARLEGSSPSSGTN